MNDHENLRKRAKQLVRAHAAGQITVAERLRRAIPRFAELSDADVLAAPFALHDAQDLIAAELGFDVWAELQRSDPPARPTPQPGSGTWHSYPQVFVRDIDRSVGWYADVLGFSLDYTYGRPPFYAQVSRNGIALNLRYTPKTPWAPDPNDVDLLAARIEVDDLKGLFLSVRKHAANLHQTLRTEPWGQTTFIVTDPDGNLLSFGSPFP